MATNPCPCGYQGHPRVPCSCPPTHVARYRRRISGPLLDRIELRVELQPPTLDELGESRLAQSTGETAFETLRARVAAAQARRQARQGELRNAELCADELDELVPLDKSTKPLLARAARARNLSARAVQSLRRVARTLADFDGRAAVGPEHVAQAIALRSPVA